LPFGPTIVLWEPDLGVIRAITSPSSARTTDHNGPSKEGRKMSWPSGVIAIRSQPDSYVRSQRSFSEIKSKHINCLIVLM
jgi:hypothetical protein